MENKHYRILSMQITNARTIEFLDITPKEDVVVIEGKNGQGKTTVLDMIEMAVKSDTAEGVVRDGEESATSIINLGEYTLRRIIKKGKPPSIEVRRVSDGKKIDQSASEFIADITGKVKERPIALDIAGIVGMDAKKRLATLLSIAGIDPAKITELDTRHKSLFEDRKDQKKELARLEAHMNSMGAYAVPVQEPASIADLTKRHDDIKKIMDAPAKISEETERAQQAVKSCGDRVIELRKQLAEAEAKLKEAEKVHADTLGKETAAKQSAEKAQPEYNAIQKQLAEAETNQTAYSNHCSYKKAKEEWAKQQSVVDKAEKALAENISQKKALLESGRFPTPNLTVEDGEIYFKETHWDQLCESEKLRVSLAIAQGLDPKFRVIIIRNGNAFDEENMAKIRAWAKETDFQVWIERVSSVPHLGDSVYLVEGKALTDDEKESIINSKNG